MPNYALKLSLYSNFALSWQCEIIKYSSISLLTVKNNSHANLRTSHAQLSEKAVSIERKTPKIKFCHTKSTLFVKKNKIIEIIFLFACLQADPA